MKFVLLVVVTVCVIVARAGEIPPTIDISALIFKSQHNHEQRLETTLQIDSALRKYGVFVATGHNLSSELFTSSQTAVNELFKVSQENKNEVSLKNTKAFGRGYLGLGEESGLSEYFEPKEGFSYGCPSQPNNDNLTEMQATNVWPSSLTSQHINTLNTVYNSKVIVVKAIIGALSSFFDENSTFPRNYLSDITNEGENISLMRLFHYFNVNSELVQNRVQKLNEARAAAESNVKSDSITDTTNTSQSTHKPPLRPPLKIIGSSPHTDWGLLTLILQDSTGGLQYLHNHTWHNVSSVQNGIVVNGGDYLSLISNYRYHSPIHRVLSPGSDTPHSTSQITRNTSTTSTVNERTQTVSTQATVENTHISDNSTVQNTLTERYSMVFFYYPNYFSEISRNEEYVFTDISASGNTVDETCAGPHSTATNSQSTHDSHSKDTQTETDTASTLNYNTLTVPSDVKSSETLNYNTLTVPSDVKNSESIIVKNKFETAAAVGENDTDSTVSGDYKQAVTTKLYFGDYIIKKWQDVSRV